jgi:6-phosphogluconate dehydrogenase
LPEHDLLKDITMTGAAERRFGVIGLGKMGGGVARHALAKGFKVIGLDKKPGREELKRAGLTEASGVSDLAAALQPRRAILLYLPAGSPVDAMLDQLTTALEPGDIIADGGNSYWGD